MSLTERRKTFSVVLGLTSNVSAFFAPFASSYSLLIRINVNGTNTDRYPKQLLRIRMKTF